MLSSCAKEMSVSLRSLEKCKGGNGVMENQLKELLLYQMVRLLFQESNMVFLIRNNARSILGLQRMLFENLSV